MPIRIPWDRYEVVLLFRAYERVANGSDINTEAANLSETLRSLAIRRGVTIDDTYRNINGMKMQLANVQYIFTDGKKGLSGASAKIRQMHELYTTNPEEYQSILKEAICNSLLSNHAESALSHLQKTNMDNGIACESVHEDTGECTTGSAFATCAGFLAYALCQSIQAGTSL